MQALEADRGAALLVGGGDRLALSEPAVEADREAPRRAVADRAADPDDAVDAGQQRRGLRLAVTGAEHDQLDRRAGRGERVLERFGRDALGPAIGALEQQALRRRAVDGAGVADDVPVRATCPVGRARRARRARAAVAAEVDDRRLELAQLAEQVERLGRPARHQLEAVAEAAALQLDLDGAGLAVEGQSVGAERIGGEEQDGVLHRRALRSRTGITRRQPTGPAYRICTAGWARPESSCAPAAPASTDDASSAAGPGSALPRAGCIARRPRSASSPPRVDLERGSSLNAGGPQSAQTDCFYIQDAHAFGSHWAEPTRR